MDIQEARTDKGNEENTKVELNVLLMLGLIGIVGSVLLFIDNIVADHLLYLSIDSLAAYSIFGLIGVIIVFVCFKFKRDKKKMMSETYTLILSGSVIIVSIVMNSWIQFNVKPAMLQDAWLTHLVGILIGAIILIVGLKLKNKHQIPGLPRATKDTKGVKGTIIFSIIIGVIFVLSPILLALIKPSWLKEILAMLPFCEIAGAILIIIGLRLKKRCQITFSKKQTFLPS
jgi:peptidoglycan/LPS O-acetylase OafA/YrhL